MTQPSATSARLSGVFLELASDDRTRQGSHDSPDWTTEEKTAGAEHNRSRCFDVCLIAVRRKNVALGVGGKHLSIRQHDYIADQFGVRIGVQEDRISLSTLADLRPVAAVLLT